MLLVNLRYAEFISYSLTFGFTGLANDAILASYVDSCTIPSCTDGAF